MKNRSFWRAVLQIVRIVLGSAVFALGFDLFLAPNRINIGGLSGVAMLLAELLGTGSVGLYMTVLNVPLFLAGYRKLGRKFFFGSLLGMTLSALFLDFFVGIPAFPTEPLLGALYGGLMAGLGLGLVFLAGASTGGTDILARLLRRKFRSLRLGKLMLMLDVLVVSLTGIVYGDISKTLYSAIPLYLSSMVIDALLYGLDYSVVAWIITERFEELETAIGNRLGRGVTCLSGWGGYTGNPKSIIMSAVHRRQVPELKTLTEEIDPGAFMILQEAHQVLGEGFRRYSDDR
ncbi:MAG: YitT family protein [Clostridia bacterium]|nr:YitT family protein [Clostridia bacterium]